MTDRELMQWALEALNRSDYLGWQLNIPIIKALRARLAEPEPEVRWDASAPLVTHPHPAFQATQPQPDLAKVGEVGVWGERQWQGLTVEEIEAAGKESRKSNLLLPYSFARAIEQALKEKNT